MDRIFHLICLSGSWMMLLNPYDLQYPREELNL